MFTQRKTDSYDLIGTNARTSDLSVESQKSKPYGSKQISQYPFEPIGALNMDSLNFALPLQRNSSTDS